MQHPNIESEVVHCKKLAYIRTKKYENTSQKKYQKEKKNRERAEKLPAITTVRRWIERLREEGVTETDVRRSQRLRKEDPSLIILITVKRTPTEI